MRGHLRLRVRVATRETPTQNASELTIVLMSRPLTAAKREATTDYKCNRPGAELDHARKEDGGDSHCAVRPAQVLPTTFRWSPTQGIVGILAEPGDQPTPFQAADAAAQRNQPTEQGRGGHRDRQMKTKRRGIERADGRAGCDLVASARRSTWVARQAQTGDACPVRSWLLKRIPLLIAAGGAVFVLLSVSITADPTLPIIDGWLDPSDTRTAAKAVLVVGVFFVVLVLAGCVERWSIRGTPNRFAGPFGFQLDWTPEDAKELREIYDSLQAAQKSAADLIQETAKRVRKLERRAS